MPHRSIILSDRLKSGVNGLLDVARQTYKEANADAYELVTELGSKLLSQLICSRSNVLYRGA